MNFMLEPETLVASCEQTLAELAKGKIDLREFDRISPKKVHDLLKEGVSQESSVRFDPERERVTRSALTLALTMIVPDEGVMYVEIGRKPAMRGSKPIWKKRKSTITCTRRRNVPIDEDAIRETEEELGLVITADQLDYGGQEVLEYQSTAYPLLWTISHVQYVECRLNKLPWSEKIKTIQDGWKKVIIQRVALPGLA